MCFDQFQGKVRGISKGGLVKHISTIGWFCLSFEPALQTHNALMTIDGCVVDAGKPVDEDCLELWDFQHPIEERQRISKIF